MPAFVAPHGIVVHDPLDPNFFKQFQPEHTDHNLLLGLESLPAEKPVE